MTKDTVGCSIDGCIHKLLFATMPNNKLLLGCGAFVVLLILILVPLSFSYIDYYDYGLEQRKSTGSVDTEKVYSSGRYALGPDRHFIKYQYVQCMVMNELRRVACRLFPHPILTLCSLSLFIIITMQY
jgi:hypothetical protein